MSLGGHKTQSTTDVRLNGININQSTYGNCIPLLYGQNRCALMLLQYENFVATPHTQQQSGGKGGGGGSSNTTFTYSASLVMGLCEGPIQAVGQIWQDKAITSLSALGLTLFTGAGGQATWSYLTSNFPARAVPYDHTAYVAIANYQLGSSAALPNFTFEVTGFLPFAYGTINDAEPSAILSDYCTDANHGCNFPYLGTLTGTNSYQTYCIAMGFFLSPYETTQRAAVDFFKEMLQITNSAGWLSAGTLKILPYADSAVSGNSQTYTPNLTPVFAFTDDDITLAGSSGHSPILIDRLPLSQTYNVVSVEYLDRSNAYNTAIATASDAQDIALNGVRVMSTLSFHQITTLAVARQVAQLILQRQLYIRSTFTFNVRADYCLLEPMDLVSITDTALGIVNKLVRIIEVDDDESDQITLVCEDMLVGTATAPLYNWQSAQGYAANYAATPPSVATPLIFVAPPLLVAAAGGYEIWIAVDAASGGGMWGGCDVYMSLDNASYIFAGTINGAARYGTLTASLANHTDPDTTDTLSIALTNAASTVLQLTSGSAADYTNLRTLIYVDGEIMAYQTATLTSAGNYNLTSLRRGLYGSVAASHASGSSFARIDAAIFRVPFDVGMMGQTVYFKFASFNIFGKAHQALSACTAYSHVLSNNNAGQNMPGALTLIGVGVTTASNTAFKSNQTSGWDSSVYSSQSYASGCSASCYAGQTNPANGIMLGLTTNPSASNSYTNLAYAFYASASGALLIYEGGTYIGAFGTYTTSTLLNIVYDGKHVAYYAGGTLVRSVPITGQTFFLQICFCDAGDAVYGIDFERGGTAVTAYTLEPMNAYTAAAGTTIVSGPNGTNGFGVRNFQSKESFTGGCIVSCSSLTTYGAYFIGVSTAPTVGGTMLAGWYLHGDSNDCLPYINGTAIVSTGAAPALTDVFTLSYDNFNFYWYKNNVLIAQLPDPNVGPLYLFGDIFASGGGGMTNVSIVPLTPSTPQQFIARGTLAFADTSASKTVNDTSWTTGDAYSINGYTTCHVVWKASQTNSQFMVGLVSGKPPASPNYTGLTYAMFCDGSGNIEIYESGTQVVASAGTYATGDYLSITYDGSTLTYHKNGTTLRSVSVSGLTLFCDVDFANSGSLNSFEFGPGAMVPVIEAAQINVTNLSNISTNLGTVTTGTFLGTTKFGVVRTYASTAGTFGQPEVVPPGATSCLIEVWGGGGSGSAKATATNCGGAGGGGYCKLSISVTPGNIFMFTQGAGIPGPIFVSTGVNGSNGNASSVTGTVSGGSVAMVANGGNAGLLTAAGTGGTASGGSTNLTGNSGTFAAPGTGGASGGPNGPATPFAYSSTPGGGGDATNSATNGGSGAYGQVQFTYS